MRSSVERWRFELVPTPTLGVTHWLQRDNASLRRLPAMDRTPSRMDEHQLIEEGS